jgi:hypothetical protein
VPAISTGTDIQCEFIGDTYYAETFAAVAN